MVLGRDDYDKCLAFTDGHKSPHGGQKKMTSFVSSPQQAFLVYLGGERTFCSPATVVYVVQC